MSGGGRTTTETKGREDKAVYLFCLAPEHAGITPEGTGVDGRNPLFVRRFGDLAALLSEVDVGDFCGVSAESNMRDLRWIGPRACRHEEVIERAMSDCPVFPARFATLFSSLHSLATLITAHHDVIAKFLDYMSDKEEWAVKVLLDRAKAEEYLFASTIDSYQQILPSSPGASYMQEKRLRTEVGKMLRPWVKTACAAMARELRGQAFDHRGLKILPRRVSGLDRDMVLNGAFLLQKDVRDGFSARMEELNAVHSERGLTLDLSGPWPPYNFCPSLGPVSAPASRTGPNQ